MNKAIRIIALCLVGGLLLAAIITSTTSKTTTADQVWDEKTAVGSLDAKNHYVMYTDLMCPYCDVFTREIINNEEAVNNYLTDKDVLFEVRVTDMLYDTSQIQYSRDSAVATYCAKNEGRFIDYYHAAVTALYEDYHSKGIGDSKTSPMITDMPDDYWVKIGEEIGLGKSFADCYYGKDTLSEVITNTTKAERVANGLPFFSLNGEGVSGYSPDWGWEALFNAGLGE